MVYSDPALWEEAKRAARERLGGHSARAMQLAGQLYRAAGGRYVGRKTKAQRSLSTWTRQDWTTKSGKASRETGERYLPRRVIEQLSSAEYAATSRAKREGTKQGKQYVKQPASIAAKVSRLKAQANPRPRKYASAAEKQAAFRARFPTICVRVEPKTADTIQKIGDASGRTQQETMLSLVKFALTNRDFVNLGLTEHKQLPRMEETRKANPMKRKPTPAQIAARERFAEMARSGAFKRKAKTSNNAKQYLTSVYGESELSRVYKNDPVLKKINADLRKIEDEYPIQRTYGSDNLFDVVETRGKEIDRLYNDLLNKSNKRTSEINRALNQKIKAKRNPAKKTVSQKISQLTREGYPQKQAVAIALSEERAGKVRRNPRASNPIILVSDKPIATRRKANPVKRKVTREKRPFYYIVKVGQSYDGQFLSSHYSLEDVKKIAQQKADKYGAQAKITEFHS